jgi:tight adherence protein C
MPLYVVIAALTVALSVPLLVLSLIGERLTSEGRISRNLHEGLSGTPDLRRLVLSQSTSERVLQPTMKALGQRVRRISPAGVIAHLERRIIVAGLALPVELVLFAKLILGGLLGVIGIGVALWSPSLKSLLLIPVAALIGYLFPDVVLARRIQRRQTSIRNELPDLLDQITICVEAGLGFDAALARTTQAASTPLSAEVTRMHQELRVGIPRREALENLLSRTDVAELRQFAHALVQAETYGVPVTQMLRAQSGEQREKRRQAAEERAMKLPVKITFPLVFCILPAMFIVILGPAVLNLLDSGF